MAYCVLVLCLCHYRIVFSLKCFFLFLLVAKHAAPLWCDDEWWLRIICTLFVVICTLFIQSICLFFWMVFNRKLKKKLSVCFVAKHAAPLWCDGVCGLRHPLGVSLQQANRKYANNFNQKRAGLSEFDLWEICCWKRRMIVIAEGNQLWRNLPQQTVKKAVDKLGPAKIQ